MPMVPGGKKYQENPENQAEFSNLACYRSRTDDHRITNATLWPLS